MVVCLRLLGDPGPLELALVVLELEVVDLVDLAVEFAADCWRWFVVALVERAEPGRGVGVPWSGGGGCGGVVELDPWAMVISLLFT